MFRGSVGFTSTSGSTSLLRNSRPGCPATLSAVQWANGLAPDTCVNGPAVNVLAHTAVRPAAATAIMPVTVSMRRMRHLLTALRDVRRCLRMTEGAVFRWYTRRQRPRDSFSGGRGARAWSPSPVIGFLPWRVPAVLRPHFVHRGAIRRQRDAVGRDRHRRRDLAVQHVGEDRRGVAIQRIAIAGATGDVLPELVARVQHDHLLGRQRLARAVRSHDVRVGAGAGRAALETPGRGPEALAAV